MRASDDHDEPDDAVLNELAQEIRQVYIFELRRHHERLTGRPSELLPPKRFDGKPDSQGKRRPPIWPQIAARVQRLRMDPVMFVSCQFDDNAAPPQPSALLLDRAVDRYIHQEPAQRKALELAFQSQVATAATEVTALMHVTGDSEADCWCSVLVDGELSLSALYRYCSAVQLYRQWKDKRFKRIRKATRPGALQQYLRHRTAYDDIWAELLPESFKAKAMEVKLRSRNWMGGGS